MRILLFFLWITLGLAYFMIWEQRTSCCDGGVLLSQDTHLSQKIPSTRQGDPEVSVQPDQPMTAEIKSDYSALEQESGCILYAWGQSDPYIKPCFEAFKDSVVTALGRNKSLEIVGEYYEAENKVMASADLGLIRASKLKALIAADLDPSRILLRSFAHSDSVGKSNKLFNSLRLRSVFMNDQVKELEDKTLIYFKYASNEQFNDQLVADYATDLAMRLRNTNDIVSLVGHTDDDATAQHNMTLGLKRAALIKNLLVSKGIKSSRIKIASRGEEEPIAPNDLEENRKLNRRVELTIIPLAQSK